MGVTGKGKGFIRCDIEVEMVLVVDVSGWIPPLPSLSHLLYTPSLAQHEQRVNRVREGKCTKGAGGGGAGIGGDCCHGS